MSSQFSCRDEYLKTILVEFFDCLSLEYGNKYEAQWNNVKQCDVINHWCKSLAGYTAAEIKKAIILWDGDWPPTLPEFKKLCGKKMNLSLVQAYHQALDGLAERDRGGFGKWDHPAIFHAAAEMRHDLKNKEWKDLKDRWEHTLAKHLSRDNLEIPPPPIKEQIECTRIVDSDIRDQRSKELRDALKTLKVREYG